MKKSRLEATRTRVGKSRRENEAYLSTITKPGDLLSDKTLKDDNKDFESTGTIASGKDDNLPKTRRPIPPGKKIKKFIGNNFKEILLFILTVITTVLLGYVINNNREIGIAQNELHHLGSDIDELKNKIKTTETSSNETRIFWTGVQKDIDNIKERILGIEIRLR